MKLFASRIGELLNVNSLASDIAMDNKTVSQYICLRQDKGGLLENYVYLQLKDKYGLENTKFWRTNDKNEVDFVVQNDKGKLYAYEVKYDKSAFSEIKYRAFTNAYPKIPLKCISLESALKLF